MPCRGGKPQTLIILLSFSARQTASLALVKSVGSDGNSRLTFGQSRGLLYVSRIVARDSGRDSIFNKRRY